MITPTVAFLEAVQDVSAGNVKIPQSEFLDHGALAVVDQGQSLVAGYTDDRRATVKTNGPLIVFGDHTRAVKYIDFPFAMGADGVKVLRVRDGFDPKYVYHYLRFREIPSVGYSRHFKFLREIAVPRPTLDEQRRVAAILDQAVALRAKRRQVGAHIDAFTQSVFHDMFIVEARWPDMPIGALGRVVTGKTPPISKANMFGGGIPFVTPGDLGSGRPVTRWLSDEGALNSRVVRRGATLVCCIGATIGKIDLARVPSAFNQQINAVEWNHGIDDSYGFEALKQIKQSIVGNAAATTLPLLTKGQFVKLTIPVPDVALQRMFAARVTQIETYGRVMSGSLLAHDELFGSLQSRAFRGEL